MTTHEIPVVHWNPRDSRMRGRVGQLLSLAPRKNNFGDLLGPILVKLIRDRNALSGLASAPKEKRRLLVVGSIMHLARDGDVIWGAGVNGKTRLTDHRFHDLDVRAVRGPLTRDYLQRLGIDAPQIYGDPALLLPLVHPDLVNWSQEKKFKLAVVPNLNERFEYEKHPDYVDPTAPVDTVLKRIAQSDRVVGSSLHGIIVAEALGVSAALIRAKEEPPFKYDDYFQGTGRFDQPTYSGLAEALDAGVTPPTLDWPAHDLLSVFPTDLWRRSLKAADV